MPPGPPFTLLEELGTASGLSAGALSCEREVPLSSGRCRGVLAPVVWHKWQSSSSSAATCLEHSPLHGRCQLARAACAASPWQAVCGSWCCFIASCQMQNNGQENASLSGTWVGMKEHHWQSSGDKLHSSFGVYPKLPMVERSRTLLALLQMLCVQLLCSSRGLAGRRVSRWVRRPEPSCSPAPLCFPFVVMSKHVVGDEADSGHSDNKEKPWFNECLNSAGGNSSTGGLYLSGEYIES